MNTCQLSDKGPAAKTAVLSLPELRRIAAMGGAYGNLPALRACLAHARQTGCDHFAFLGDATGCCGHSDEVVRLVRENFTTLIAGNHEHQAVAGSDSCGCNYASSEDEHYGSLAHQYAMKSLGAENRLWLSSWPDLALLDTAAGRLLLCHGSPAQTNEFLYESQLDDRRLAAWLDQFEAVGLICTHTGFPWTRILADGRFAMNCGVIGRPDHDHDAAVHYGSVDIKKGRFTIGIERVEYDHQEWADQLDRERVDDIFTIPLRNGVWTCGLESAPAAERVLRARHIDRAETFK